MQSWADPNSIPLIGVFLREKWSENEQGGLLCTHPCQQGPSCCCCCCKPSYGRPVCSQNLQQLILPSPWNHRISWSGRDPQGPIKIQLLVLQNPSNPIVCLRVVSKHLFKKGMCKGCRAQILVLTSIPCPTCSTHG